MNTLCPLPLIALSKDVTRDMTQALTKVDEKGRVSLISRLKRFKQKSGRASAEFWPGVKASTGVLAEFSLAGLYSKDLLPAAQYIANVKMKPDETGDVCRICS